MALSTIDTTDKTLGARRQITAVFGDGSTAPTAGNKILMPITYDCEIESATMEADVSGSAVINIWRDDYPTIPDSADKINASAPPTLSSQQVSQDTTLTGWTKTVTANSNLMFELTSVTTCKRVVLTLTVAV